MNELFAYTVVISHHEKLFKCLSSLQYIIIGPGFKFFIFFE